ncbi:MAG: hypothetical protein Kow001_11500 [Acidobacteriota bacterium]
MIPYVNSGVETVELLLEFLRRNPQWELLWRRHPLQLRWRGRWHPVREIRPLGTALELLLQSGRRIRLPWDPSREAHRQAAATSLTGTIQALWPQARVRRLSAREVGPRRYPAFLCRAILDVPGTGRRRERWKLLALSEQAELDPAWLAGRLTVFWDRPPEADRAVLLIPSNWNDYIIEILDRLNFPVECWRRTAGSPTNAVRIFPRDRTDLHCRSPYTVLPMEGGPPPELAAIARDRPTLDLLYRKSRWELSVLGLPVLWVEPEGLAYDHFRPRLLAGDWEGWEAHLAQILSERTYPSPNPRSPYYRFAPERWLEAQLIRNRHSIRPDLQDAFYCQVPTYVEGCRKVIDLLAVTRTGRLTVVEIKAHKDGVMFFQGVEYWQRVYDHLRHGDFPAAGYFPGIELSQEPPLLYLVSPWFEFHRDLALYRSYVSADVEIRCIGLGGDWRRRLTIVRRFEL